jgi:hypothetical protein
MTGSGWVRSGRVRSTSMADGENNRKKFICDIISEVGRKDCVTKDVLSDQSTEVERDILVFNNDAVLTYLFINLLFQQKFSNLSLCFFIPSSFQNLSFQFCLHISIPLSVL